MIAIARRLEEERKRLKFVQEDIAKICKTTTRTVISWESGKKIPSHQLARMIPAGMDAWYVLTGERLTCDSGAIHDYNLEPTKEGETKEISLKTYSYSESHQFPIACDSSAIIGTESHLSSEPIDGAGYKDSEVHARLKLAIGDEKPFAWAARVGIEKATFSRIWNQGTVPTGPILKKIAQSGISIDWLLTGKGPKNIKPSVVMESAHQYGKLDLSKFYQRLEYIRKAVQAVEVMDKDADAERKSIAVERVVQRLAQTEGQADMLEIMRIIKAALDEPSATP
jgi:transcriptional regulator with XRE-family HTH domain